MAFQAPKLTNAGKALYYDNMAGAQITITTIKMGSGTLAGPIANLTDLVEPVVVVDALATVRDNYVDVSGTFSNADLDQGFYWREIGVFAANPDDPENREADILYCYQNAYDTADYIPVASVETVEKNIVVPIIVGDAAAVSCTLDHSLVLATLKDLEDHENDKNAHPGLTHYDPIGSAEKAVLEHDKDDTSHEDIRTALSNKVDNIVPISEEDDLNKIFESGFYRLGGTTKNVPDGCEWGILIVSGDNNTVLQIVSDHGNTKFLKRTYRDASIWTDWVPISTATPTQEYDLPLQDGWTASQSDVCKYSKDQFGIVHISLSVIPNEPVSIHSIIGTLPVGFRPRMILHRAIAFSTVGGLGMAVVTGSGELYIYPFSEMKDVTASIFFVAAD